jgi:hypothetical protein
MLMWLVTCDCNCAVTVSSTGAKNLLQGEDNGHVGRPCEVSLAPPELFCELVGFRHESLSLGSENRGGSFLTASFQGDVHLTPAKFWVHSTRNTRTNKMHSKFWWSQVDVCFFFRKNRHCFQFLISRDQESTRICTTSTCFRASCAPDPGAH